MPTKPLTPADLFAMIDGIEATHILVDGQVYDRGDCAPCCWCGTVEPVDWLKALPNGYVCEECEEDRAYQMGGDYAVAMGRVL